MIHVVLQVYLLQKRIGTHEKDTLFLSFLMAQNCQSVGQYSLNKDGTLSRSDKYEYQDWINWSLANLEKDKLNSDLEPGTELLLYIPQGCTMTLDRVSRWFFARGHHEPSLPETILVSDEIPSECRPRSWFSQIRQWIIQALL